MNLSESLDEVMRQLRAQEGQQEVLIRANNNPPQHIAEANLFLAWALQRSELVNSENSSLPVFKEDSSSHGDCAPDKYYHPMIRKGELRYTLKSPLDDDGLKSIFSFFERVKAFSKADWTIDRSGPIPHIVKPLPHYREKLTGEALEERRIYDLLVWMMYQRKESEFPEEHTMHRSTGSYMKKGSLEVDMDAVKVSPYCHFSGNNSLHIQNEEGPAFVYRMTGVDLNKKMLRETK